MKGKGKGGKGKWNENGFYKGRGRSFLKGRGRGGRKGKGRSFLSSKGKSKGRGNTLAGVAITVESLVTTNLSAGRKKEILEVLEKFKKKMKRVLQV